MPGRKTLLSSISSLARTPSWVSKKVRVSHKRERTSKTYGTDAVYVNKITP